MRVEQAHLALIRRILAKRLYVGVEAYAFGSRVHGRHVKKYSDFDICLKGQVPVPDAMLAKLIEAFEKSSLPFTVDLVDWHRLTEDFQKTIARDFVALRP